MEKQLRVRYRDVKSGEEEILAGGRNYLCILQTPKTVTLLFLFSSFSCSSQVTLEKSLLSRRTSFRKPLCCGALRAVGTLRVTVIGWCDRTD